MLTFFVVNATFNQYPNIRLDLPTTKYAKAAGAAEEGLVLNITKDGKMLLQDQPIAKEDLEWALRQRVQEQRDAVLILRADKEVSYGVVIGVMDVAKGVGLKRITAITLSKEEAP
jgi:biopolymer transport protein ExbD